MMKMDLRVKKTYKQLLDAFLILMSEKSFEELSVSEICDKAQVHRATFYKHFKDKNEFLNFCFENYLSQIGFKASQETPSAENIKDSFMSFIMQIFEYITNNKAVFKIICSDEYIHNLGPTFTMAVNSFILEKIKQIIPNATDASANLFAAFYSNAFIGIVTWYARCGTADDLDAVYSFLESRVDELCSTYIQKYI